MKQLHDDPLYACAGTGAKRHTSVRKLFLPLMRTTSRAICVILGGSSLRSCAAACCKTSTGWPCRLRSFNCSSMAKPSVNWQSYFSSVSTSSTVSLTVKSAFQHITTEHQPIQHHRHHLFLPRLRDLPPTTNEPEHTIPSPMTTRGTLPLTALQIGIPPVFSGFPHRPPQS